MTDASAPHWSLYEVTVTVGDYAATSTLSAASRSGAVYQAFLSYSDVWTISFRDFLTMVRARRVTSCADDGYGYVRRAYGVDPRIGAEVELVDEGDWTAKRGRIVHPGKSSTAYVHVAFAGIRHALSCHPNSVRMIEGQP
ncbi:MULTISPECIES: hypothetical protein [Brevundimonas]|uniref:Uncharacterized protein n=1 Tax=Brevundimonas vancanneytii TaxID=1325724 RepID=A0A4P1JR65_9CAUL|nr:MULTISPECIES: hypothetical protein [Brevundimonas]VTO10627.1 Uncharacterised protein [Brevundimonas vancanneytii]